MVIFVRTKTATQFVIVISKYLDICNYFYLRLLESIDIHNNIISNEKIFKVIHIKIITKKNTFILDKNYKMKMLRDTNTNLLIDVHKCIIFLLMKPK